MGKRPSLGPRTSLSANERLRSLGDLTEPSREGPSSPSLPSPCSCRSRGSGKPPRILIETHCSNHEPNLRPLTPALAVRE